MDLPGGVRRNLVRLLIESRISDLLIRRMSSAYDKEAVYEAIEAHSPERRTRVVIPPQRNATLSRNSNTAMRERDRHIRAIERHGRREWYKLSGCTKRSMVENAVYRYKAIIGPEMRARTLARQRVEHRIGCEILNKMTALGMP